MKNAGEPYFILNSLAKDTDRNILFQDDVKKFRQRFDHSDSKLKPQVDFFFKPYSSSQEEEANVKSGNQKPTKF